MISTYDFYYIPRVKNLERQYKKCESKLQELNESFNACLEIEACDPYVLNVLHSRIIDIEELMISLDDEMERLRLETLN